MRLVLVASPLLGPAVWRPVADELVRHGWSVLLPPPYAEVATPADVLTHVVAAVGEEQPVVLVLHSNAGLYAAALAARLDLRGIVFVDAGLPADDRGTPTAPAAFRDFLAGLAGDDGRLPPWTQWWDAEDLADLFPDPRSRAAVEVEQRRLPLEYFEARVPSPPGWEALPAAYLGFGDTYAAEQAVAASRGWPVHRLAGLHLHTLVDPVAVASALEGLLGRMGLESPGGGPIRV